MKCEHCGKNEVAYRHYRSVNGNVTKVAVCEDCARKLGFLPPAGEEKSFLMDEFFGSARNSFFKNRSLDDFFGPMPGLSSRNWLWEDPFEELFAEMPALRLHSGEAAQEEPKKEKEELLDEKERGRISGMRRLNALRLEMKRAVQEENFERAAQLRDEIRALEKEQSGDSPESA